MDVQRRVRTYTVREAHWFESIFTGNNVSFNTNGIQCICTDRTKTKDRILSVKEYFQKVSVLRTDKRYLKKKYLCYVQIKVLKKRVSVLFTDKSFVFENILICTRNVCMHIKKVGLGIHK